MTYIRHYPPMIRRSRHPRQCGYYFPYPYAPSSFTASILDIYIGAINEIHKIFHDISNRGPTMTDITKVNSGGEFETLCSYSRLVMVDNWIFTSNSAGVIPETGKFPSDPVEQAKQVLRNLEHALAQVGSNLSDVVRRTVRIPNRQDIFPIMECVGAAFKGIDPASTVTCTPLGSDEYKLEIELIAYKGAGSQKQTRIRSKWFGE